MELDPIEALLEALATKNGIIVSVAPEDRVRAKSALYARRQKDPATFSGLTITEHPTNPSQLLIGKKEK